MILRLFKNNKDNINYKKNVNKGNALYKHHNNKSNISYKHSENQGIVLITLLIFISILSIIIVSSLFVSVSINTYNNDVKNHIVLKSKIESASEDIILKLLRNPIDYDSNQTLLIDNVLVQSQISNQSNIYTIISSAQKDNYYHSLKVVLDVANNKIIVQSWNDI